MAIERRRRQRADGSLGAVHYRASVRGPGGERRSASFAKRSDAERWEAAQRADASRGLWIDPASGRVTFGEYARDWAALQVHRATTVAQVESNLRNHVLPYFASRPLASIRTSEVQAWVRARSEELAPATVEVVYRYLVAIFRAALADRLIATNPCQGVKLPKVERPQVVPLPTEAVLGIAEAVPNRYRGLVLTGAGTGLRQGELLGLTLPRVDFLRRSVEVAQQLVLLPGAPPYLAPPKTQASYRSVPLSGAVLEVLAGHLTVYPAGEQGLVFTADDGGPIRRNRLGDVWRRAVLDAGLPPGTRFHELRHYFASLLIHAGASVKVVQARLGHASATETLDTYGHLWPDSEDHTRQAIDAILGAAVGASGQSPVAHSSPAVLD